MTAMYQGRVLIIAGSDSGGGAGIQGDIKTVTCLGGYAATAITALTAQNTRGVFGVHEVPEAFIRQQMKLVVDDIGVDAFKTGMLHKASVIEAVAAELEGKKAPLVLDPVMFAKGGHPLLEVSATETLTSLLIPMAAIITPNIPEAEHLSGMEIRSGDDMLRAAEKLMKSGCRAALMKGGHMEGDEIVDVLVSEDGVRQFRQPRQHSAHTHGTGCALASGIAVGLAQGMGLEAAVVRARDYVRYAIAAAPGLGGGHGPLGHFDALKEMKA